MTTIIASPYASQNNIPLTSEKHPYYNKTSVNNVPQQNAAATVTLSQEAKNALGAENITKVIVDAQRDFKLLLEETGKISPLENGELAVDLTRFNRRALFVISSNRGKEFSPDEKIAASYELQRRFDTALSGPAAVVRITEDYLSLYSFASNYLSEAGPEEKSSSLFQSQEIAIGKALEQLVTSPGSPPSGIENDPVSNYLMRVSNGDVIKERDFTAVTNDVRAALNYKYKNPETGGGNGQGSDKSIDLSYFGGRALSAIVLDRNNDFNSHEKYIAKTEINSRIRKAVQVAFQTSNSVSDPTAFSKNLIAQYQSISSEERAAAGFTQDYYDTLLKNHETSTKILQSFSGLSISGDTNGAKGVSSLLDYI